MKKLLSSLLFSLLCLNANANIVVNGDFSNGLNSFVASATGVSVRQGADYTSCCQATGTYNGGLFASFGYGNSTGGILYQDLSTIAGTTYNLSFLYGALIGSQRQIMFIELFDPTTMVSAAMSVGGFLPSNDLNQFMNAISMNFVATSSITRLQFRDASPSTTSSDGILDNVAVNVVPEPASMMLLGLGMLGLLASRRKLK